MSRKPVSLLLGVAVGALLSASTAVAQTYDKSKTTDTSKSRMGQTSSSTSLASSDASFLKKAALGGLEEVELGKLAADKASNPDVKAFGQKMVDDHTRSNDGLMKLAQQKNLQVPSAPDASGKREIDKLSKLSGAAFDKAYMKEMVEDHKKDFDVKNFASTTLPTLKEHLDMAKTDHAKVAGVKTSKAKTAGTS